jgi:hypothetical protein
MPSSDAAEILRWMIEANIDTAYIGPREAMVERVGRELQ